MRKGQLLTALRKAGAKAPASQSDQLDFVLARYLTWYLERDVVPEFEHGGIVRQLPRLIGDAWELLRTGLGDERWFGPDIAIACGNNGLPDLFDPKGGAHRMTTLNSLVSFTERVLLDRYQHREFTGELVRGHFLVQDTLIEQTFDRFFRSAPRSVTNFTELNLTRAFGSTSLRSLRNGGRRIFTFARQNDDSGESVTLVGPEDDQLGIGFGLHSLMTDYRAAVTMIEEVAHYYKERNQPNKVTLS